MKQLFDRFKRKAAPEDKGPALPARPAAADSETGDSAFFSTQFTEREESAAVVTWATRGVAVGAQPAPRETAEALLARLLHDDRYFAALEPGAIERLAAQLQFVQVAPGRQVIGQDEQGDYMLIVLEGVLAVDRVQPWGGRTRLAEARAGDMLGEMSLLDAGARFSACTTLSACTLAVVDAAGLDALVRDEPKLALALMASLSRRLSLRLRQVSARLSALLSGR